MGGKDDVIPRPAPQYDHLFDLGYISFDADGAIMVSDEMSGDERRALGVCDTICIGVLDDQTEQFMQYHRSNIFKKSTLKN